MKKLIQEEKRCEKCNNITQHKDYAESCEWCGKLIDEKKKSFHINVVNHGAEYRGELEPHFDKFGCLLAWFTSPKFLAWKKNPKLNNCFFGIDYPEMPELMMLRKMLHHNRMK